MANHETDAERVIAALGVTNPAIIARLKAGGTLVGDAERKQKPMVYSRDAEYAKHAEQTMKRIDDINKRDAAREAKARAERDAAKWDRSPPTFTLNKVIEALGYTPGP